ncbi:MAG: hypothetical protein ILA26_09745 [Methanobrevibacter sp.]|uniref:hypothetical protein n=1 Tax=Methanobrevibacter sp. TaxID=66852 RepID=UPI001B6EA401|nr:hypothetical protein [Methanobrevibacter sp.]MBP3792295.1 hypothetical protein [Methanobrevibacter sp.]
MSFINEIKIKFQHLLGFEKLNPLNNFDFEETIEKYESKDNIVLFKSAFKKQREYLFDRYIAQNIERFVVEFNSRMEKFNVCYVYIRL